MFRRACAVASPDRAKNLFGPVILRGYPKMCMMLDALIPVLFHFLSNKHDPRLVEEVEKVNGKFNAYQESAQNLTGGANVHATTAR